MSVCGHLTNYNLRVFGKLGASCILKIRVYVYLTNVDLFLVDQLLFMVICVGLCYVHFIASSIWYFGLKKCYNDINANFLLAVKLYLLKHVSKFV